jgi:outer membrane protein TolC
LCNIAVPNNFLIKNFRAFVAFCDIEPLPPYMKKLVRLSAVLVSLIPLQLFAQGNSRDSLPLTLTLKQCIDFALRNQPAVRQANIDEEINERDIRISLAAWLPQVNSTGSFQHYLQRNVNLAAGAGTGTGTGTGTGGTGTGGTGTGGTGTGGTGTGGTGTGGTGTGGTGTGGVGGVGGTQQLAIADNVSSLGLSASQVIYNNEVLQASKASRFSRQYYKQNTQSTKIDVVANVSKAFYDVLLSQRQLDIIKQDIARLQRNLKDANARHQAGVVDKIDAKQATIALNNSLATRKQLQEAVNSRLAYLKQLMGYQPERQLNTAYDSVTLSREMAVDTMQTLNVHDRIEYNLLETQKNLQGVNVSYYKYGFLPSLSAVGSYNLLYFNNRLSSLYKDAFPTSLVGLSLNLPIFTGSRRLQNLSKARLQVTRTDIELENTRNAMNTEYTQAMASYKSNLTNWQALGQNVQLAKDVYNVVSLQYREGIKTYLDLIVAQTDLRTAELNYYTAMFQLLSSKIDLQRALGKLPVQ